jgi:hypothetical protein
VIAIRVLQILDEFELGGRVPAPLALNDEAGPGHNGHFLP